MMDTTFYMSASDIVKKDMVRQLCFPILTQLRTNHFCLSDPPVVLLGSSASIEIENCHEQQTHGSKLMCPFLKPVKKNVSVVFPIRQGYSWAV